MLGSKNVAAGAIVLLLAVAALLLALRGSGQLGDAGTTAASSVAAASSEPPFAALNPWGPLAVIPPQDGSDTGRLEGTLRITEMCVVLMAGRDSYLLFWQADRTKWSPQLHTITFMNFDGTVVTVHDGQKVALGGGGDSSAESGISVQEWIRTMTWIAPPSLTCPLDLRWGVGAVID